MTTETMLITGANKGIGLGFVEYYLTQGYVVYATCRKVEQADALKQLSKHYNNLYIFPLDVANEHNINSLPEKLQGINFDLIINNAGVSIGEAFGRWTQASFNETFMVNLLGPALITQALANQVVNGGKIIQISSGMGSLDWKINPLSDLDAYAASKVALNMITRRVSDKLRVKNITVIALNPGWVKTDSGGKEAPTSVTEAVELMADVIAKRSLKDTGQFFSEQGKLIPW